MNTLRRRALLAAAAAAAAAAMLGAGTAAPTYAAEPLKVAFVYVGPVGDGGWTFQHDQARLALEREFGARIKTTYAENVPETADAERVIRQLAADGNALIFTTSFAYMDPTIKVARLFPKVHFVHVTGYKSAANVGTVQTRFYEGAYLCGIVAGKMTKTNTLGFVGSFPVPEVVRNLDAYTLGARSVNPKVRTKVVWVNNWYDPGKERQAAETLIAQGADVLAQNTDSPAVVQTAEQKGVHAFGWDSDMAKYGPHAQLTANTENWAVYYADAVKKQLDGTWKPEQTLWGIKEGIVVLPPLNKAVPADVVKLFDEKKAAIANGTLQPFAGPLKDTAGVTKVAAGAVLPVQDMLSMNWLVEGVDGTLPK